MSGGKTGGFESLGLAMPSAAWRCQGLVESVSRDWALATVSPLPSLQVKAQPAPCFPPGKTPRRDQLSHTRPRPQTHRSCQVVSGLCPKLVSLCRFASMARGHSWALQSPRSGSAPASAPRACRTSQASSLLHETRHRVPRSAARTPEATHEPPEQDSACR